MDMDPYRDLPPIKATLVQIEETDSGWRLRWDQQDFEDHTSAVQALQAVKDRDRVMAKRMTVLTTIEWTVTSDIGRAVVKVLAGSDPTMEVK